MTSINHFRLSQSSILFGILLGFHLIVLLLIVGYFSGWLLLGLVLLILLLQCAELTQYRKTTDTSLILNNKSNEITLDTDGSSKHFSHFKLYSNRWFLILKLGQKGQSESLILLSDRFHTIKEYLRFRHQIIKMNHNTYVD